MANVDSTSRADMERMQRTGLPDAPNVHVRPLWEPPIFNHSDLIGEEYEKKRETAWKYTGGDVVKTTAIMDLTTEYSLIVDYWRWAYSSEEAVANAQSQKFYAGLAQELYEDTRELLHGPADVNGHHFHEMEFEKLGDGTYVAMSSYDYKALMDQRAELREISNAARPSRFATPDPHGKSSIWPDEEHHPIAVRMQHMCMGMWLEICHCGNTCDYCVRTCPDNVD